MKRILVATAGTATLAAALFSSPVAAAGPVAGCGNGLTLATVQQGIDAVDWSIYTAEDRAAIEAAIQGLDAAGNADGYLCVRQWKPSKGRDNHWGGTDYVVTGLSENNARGQLG